MPFILFSFLCGWIIAVSALDTVLLVQYAGHICEINPLAAWLIKPCPTFGQDVSLLVYAKVCGTASVAQCLMILWYRWRAAAWWVAGTLAIFQTLLLCYLFT